MRMSLAQLLSSVKDRLLAAKGDLDTGYWKDTQPQLFNPGFETVVRHNSSCLSMA